MADEVPSPESTHVVEPNSFPGETISAVFPADAPVPDVLKDDDEDDDDDIPRARPRGDRVNTVNDDEGSNLGDEDDLFGDGGDDEDQEEAEP